MNSSAPGNNTLAVEVTHISAHGIWLLAHDEELFLSYDDFPWFRDKSVSQILDVQEPSPNHFFWPSLDVDLALESIRHPEQFPLKSRS